MAIDRRMLARWCPVAFGFLLFGVSFHSALGQRPTKATDADVDRAIKVCTIGQKLDVKVDAGLRLLKSRIVGGEGRYTESEIPSVIGEPVQGDKSKIEAFKIIQDCVVDKVYAAAPPLYEFTTWPTPPVTAEMDERYAGTQVEHGHTASRGNQGCFGPPNSFEGKAGWLFNVNVRPSMKEDTYVCNNGVANTGGHDFSNFTEQNICVDVGARTSDPSAIVHCTTTYHAVVSLKRQTN